MPDRRPNGSPPLPIHSIRVPDETWIPAKERATAEDETLTAAINRFLQAYAQGGDVTVPIGKRPDLVEHFGSRDRI